MQGMKEDGRSSYPIHLRPHLATEDPEDSTHKGSPETA